MTSSKHQGLLFVDGYNIIGSWIDLKKTRDRQGFDSARQQLIEALISFAAYKEFKTEIVFDAHYQKTPGYQEKYTSSLSVYYTDFEQTADTYIEKICASFKHSQSGSNTRLIVATSDETHRRTVIGYGAEWLSAQRLQTEVDVTALKIRRKQRPQKQSPGRFLFNSLDTKSQEVFAQWRHGIH